MEFEYSKINETESVIVNNNRNLGVDVMTGSSLRGYVEAKYDDLVKLFGEPTFDFTTDDFLSDGKVDIEWTLQLEVYCDLTGLTKYHYITIYNWKDYDGGARCKSDNEYTWHIGGHNDLAQNFIQQILDTQLSEGVPEEYTFDQFQADFESLVSDLEMDQVPQDLATITLYNMCKEFVKEIHNSDIS